MTESDLTQQGGYLASHPLFDLRDPPTAIIGVNDLTALGALRAAQERGIIVGKELAIAGFDGTEAGEHAHPSLTTIAQPVYSIGREVCRLLVQILSGEAVNPRGHIIEPELIIRASTNFKLE
jgi:DNA-binding LacI/PurR family transcriptional regulator